METSRRAATKLSQWEALMLESLKTYGWTNDELISRVHAGNLPQDDSKFQFKYDSLTELAKEQPDLFKRAATEGYQIKYNTIRGIHSWILVTLKHEAELVLESGSEAVIATLSNKEAQRLAAVLSYGWTISPAHNESYGSDVKAVFRITPIGIAID